MTFTRGGSYITAAYKNNRSTLQNTKNKTLSTCFRSFALEMRLLIPLVFLSIVTLAMGQKDGDYTCSSNVVVLTKEDLAQEIQSQFTTKAPSSALTSGSGCVINTSEVTEELYKRIVKLDKEELTDLQGALNCHTDTYESCQEILLQDGKSPSGYYWLRRSDITAEKVYCDMDRICGNVRGWMRIAELDMTDPDSRSCPGGFYEAEHDNKSLCATTATGAGCAGSVTYSTRGIRYNKICGRVRAYQKGRLDGFHYAFTSINSNYMDGISITHQAPNSHNRRRHIWTFVASRDENGGGGQCPCINRNNRRSTSHPLHYIGLNYFCDTAIVEYQSYYDDFRVFTNNPLWDGAGCGPSNDCCAFNTPPWFYRHLEYSTTDDIEMRLCRNNRNLIEDVLIEKVDLFVC